MTASIRYLRMLLHLPTGGRRAIGYVSQFGDVVRVSFDEDYIEDPQRPTLSLLYRGANDVETRAILRATRDARVVRSDGRLPTWFANLLPEGHNRERLAALRGCEITDEFELLAAAGHDLSGALEVEPVDIAAGVPETVRIWHAAMGMDVRDRAVVSAPTEDATSLSGMVTKFSAVKEGVRYVVKRHGKPGAYILKLPSTRHPDLVDNELAGYRLAGALGIDCAHAVKVSRRYAELPEHLEFSHVLAVKRFDRGPGGTRVHMEEFAQAMGLTPREKYGRGIESDVPTMLRILDQLSVDPARDVQEMVRRLVAFVLMGNSDAHLKNWALVYKDSRGPSLSPLYDPVCVAAWFEAMPAHEYVLNRKIDTQLARLTMADLRALLVTAQVPRVARLIQIAKDTVRLAKAEWPALLRSAPANMRRSVTARLAGGVALAG
jgi:serine/threonine-protein kinase HipA